MPRALGIINFSENHIWVNGLEEYRSVSAFSFLGRYRVIDFPISNMTNSGIDRIQVYIRRKPQELVQHLGTGRQFNINSKSGFLNMMFASSQEENDSYNTDVKAYLEYMDTIESRSNNYVVIAPGYMLYLQDFDALLRTHIESGADVTVLYHPVDNAKDAYQRCYCVNLNRQGGLTSFEMNRGTEQNRSIFMDTYVMRKDLFLQLVREAHQVSSMYTLRMIVNDKCSELDIRGVAHQGFFAAITDFQSYYDANFSVDNLTSANRLFRRDWPIYTRTNNSCPTRYYESADVSGSFVSNGSVIEGTVEHSVIGRDCKIRAGAVVKDCILLSNVTIGENVHIEGQVVDEDAKVCKVKEILADPQHPGYIRRGDQV